MHSVFKYKGIDWLGMILAAISLYYLGRFKKRGFIFAIAGNIAWLAFAWMAESVANLVSCLVYLGFNIRGWINWDKDQEKKQNRSSPPRP